MSRLWSSGFELNSTASGMEFTSVAGATIQTSVVRSGTYAGKISSLASATAQYFRYQFAASTLNVTFMRFYINITTLPSAENTIYLTNDQINLTTPITYITLDNTGVLRLYDEDGVIGSPSSVLSTGTWYSVEMQFDRSGSSGSHIVNARLNGTQFAGATNRAVGAGMLVAHWGANLKAEAQTTGLWYFEDLAINDNSGSFQNGYAGEGKIVHLKPNAAGDNNSFTVQVGGTAGSTNNFSRVDEIPPDDATSYNADAVLNDLDDFNIDDTPAVMDDEATINVVQVGVRYSALIAALESTFKVRVKKASGGTISKSGAITPSSVTWVTNANAAPFNQPLTLYQDPDSVDWKKQTLDSAQIGYEISTGNTNATAVSNIWLMVDYTPGVGDSNGFKISLKPLAPTINWNNPLTKNLSFCASLSVGGGITEVDLFRKLSGTLSGSTPVSWNPTLVGRAAHFTSSSSQYITFGEPTGFPPNRNFSMFGLFNHTDNSNDYGIFGFANGGPFFRVNSGQIQFLRSQIANIIPTSSVVAATIWHTVLITLDQNSTANVVLYIDGKKDQTATTTQTFNYFDSPVNSRLIIGGDWSNQIVTPFNGDISLCALWNRVLNAQEAKELSANPWQMFNQPGLLTNLR